MDNWVHKIVALVSNTPALVPAIISVLIASIALYFTARNYYRRPTLNITILGQNVLPDIYFALPFAENTLFAIPLTVIISNTGNKTAKNVTIVIELPDSLYRHYFERSPDKVSVMRRVQIVADANSKTYVARAYYVIPEIHPHTATDIQDHIFATKDSIIESSFDVTTKDGIPITVPYKVYYSFKLKVDVIGDDIAPRKIECKISLRQGDFNNVEAVIDRENELIYEHAEKTGEVSRGEMTLITFKNFIQEPVEKASLVVCRADSSSMVGVNLCATTIGFRPRLALSPLKRAKYGVMRYFVTTFPAIHRSWQRGKISKQLKRVKLRRRLKLELGPWQRSKLKGRFRVRPLTSLFFATTTPNPIASVFSINLHMSGTAGFTDHTELVLSYPARCLITNDELKQLAPEGSNADETYLKRRSYEVVGDIASVTHKIDKLVSGETRILAEPILLVAGGTKGGDGRFSDSGFASCLHLISTIPNLSDAVIMECRGTSKSSRSIRKTYNIGWLIEPQYGEQGLERFLNGFSSALWFGEKPPLNKMYARLPWNNCRIIREELAQICLTKLRTLNPGNVPSLSQVITKLGVSDDLEDIALGRLFTPDCEYHRLPKHISSTRHLTRWMGVWCLSDQFDHIRKWLPHHHKETGKS
jgi:hypothetical protein